MKRERILVGMSGGVDSSVAAARLVEAGHEVVGVYLKAWDDGESELLKGICPWRDDIADCRRVAAQLGIPFEVIDVQAAYRARVVDVLLSEYAAGRTPNPDILCNREMKFGLLLDLAHELEFNAVATGHYAQIVDGQLHSGVDPEKIRHIFCGSFVLKICHLSAFQLALIIRRLFVLRLGVVAWLRQQRGIARGFAF